MSIYVADVKGLTEYLNKRNIINRHSGVDTNQRRAVRVYIQACNVLIAYEWEERAHFLVQEVDSGVYYCITSREDEYSINVLTPDLIKCNNFLTMFDKCHWGRLVKFLMKRVK